MHLIINFLIYFLIFTNSTLSLSPSRRHGVMSLSYSLSPSRLSLSFLFFFSFFPSFLAFLFGFGVLLTVRFSSFFFLFSFLHIYIYFKVFMGSWKLLDWLAGIGMGEVRGAQAKNQGPKLFLWKFYILKKKIFGPRGGPGPLCPLPGSVPASSWTLGLKGWPYYG